MKVSYTGCFENKNLKIQIVLDDNEIDVLKNHTMIGQKTDDSLLTIRRRFYNEKPHQS